MTRGLLYAVALILGSLAGAALAGGMVGSALTLGLTAVILIVAVAMTRRD